MSERPPHGSHLPDMPPRESVVLANVSIGYPVMAKALNQAADRFSGSKRDSQDIKCIRNDVPKIRECLTVNWRVNYASDGEISVDRDGPHLKVTVPARFSGTAGLGGELARFVSFNQKRFDGSFVISASASLSFDERFCPVVTPGSVSFAWTNEGRVQLIGRNSFRILGIEFSVGPWNLEVGRHMNGPIRDALKKALVDASGSIPCEPFRDELAKAWRNYSFPLNVEGMPTMFVNVDPTALSTSGLIVEGDGVRLVARMVANVVVEASKGSEAPKGELPVNVPVDADQGHLSLSVPLKLPYGVITSAAMKAIGGKPQDIGGTKVVVEDLEMYPSVDKIAVGIKFSADLPWRLFDAKGIVWVTARPVVEEDGKVVRLEGVEWSVSAGAIRAQSIDGGFLPLNEDLGEQEAGGAAIEPGLNLSESIAGRVVPHEHAAIVKQRPVLAPEAPFHMQPEIAQRPIVSQPRVRLVAAAEQGSVRL